MMRAQHTNSSIATLTMLAIYVELTISANFLTYIGLPYVTEGGALILKLHPGTDLLIISFSLFLLSDISANLSLLPVSLFTYFTSLSICMLCSLIFTGAGNLIVFLDTFLPAGLAAALIGGMTSRATLRLRLSMQCLFVMNAVMALAEAFTKCTLIPLYLNNESYSPKLDEFRPMALYDHPLTGALMTMMGMALAPSSGIRRRAYLILMWLAMLTFGGRVAIATSMTAILLTKGLPIIAKSFSWNRQARQRLFLAIAGLFVAAPIFLLIVWSGFADRLSSHLYWDASAQIRLQQWNILTYLDARQVFFGTPREELLENLNALRLSSGVGVLENFWLLMFVGLGIFGFPVFLVMIGSLCFWCWKVSSQKGRSLLVSVLIVASSSNSLGRKSTVLVCLVASVACTDCKPIHVRKGTLWRGLPRPVEIG